MELRERVASGGDPTKLREPPVVGDISIDEQGIYFNLFLLSRSQHRLVLLVLSFNFCSNGRVNIN